MSSLGIPPSYPPSLWTVLLPVRYHLPRSWFRLVFVFSVDRLVSRRCHNILALPRPLPICGTMGVLTPDRRHLGGQTSPFTSHTFRPFRLQPRVVPCHRFEHQCNVADVFQASPYPSRLAAPLPPNRVRHPADWSFVSSCSPPRLAATQLLSTTEFWYSPTRTFTVLM
jgi:hypothetical protein